jgi:hypothetical protein
MLAAEARLHEVLVGEGIDGFRIVQREVVLEDIRRQAAAGAQHITFGDLKRGQSLHAESWKRSTASIPDSLTRSSLRWSTCRNTPRASQSRARQGQGLHAR